MFRVAMLPFVLILLYGYILPQNGIIDSTFPNMMFPGFLTPLVFTGAIFFPWSALSNTPIIQTLILINPLLYVNDALRSVLTPEITSMPLWVSLIGIVISILIMSYFGWKRFNRMATGEGKF